MREILYRGKCIYNGEWVYGNLMQGSTSVCISQFLTTDTLHRVDPDTVGQYTGLTDKNNTKIFEGDILRYPPENRIEVNNYVSYEVFWHDNDCADRHIGWQMNRHHYHGNVCGTINDFTTCLPKYTKKMIIVGNIFDLKGDEI